ncbi:MAG: PTS mannose/fructose/sorbose transporter subunit IIB [Gemmatimonadales bacterium]|nr:MAG: PTS mannose/fructose/sorbose transporter subunit IIB [Gemmatimonadales bacterium]
MSIALCRVDDRLIHGQVLIGWGVPLHLELIVLVDDAVRGSDWERDIYSMAVPSGIDVEFVSGAEAAQRVGEWARDSRNVVILAASLETMSHLVKASEGLITRVNLGGIHHEPGRTKRLPYVYLTEDEVAQLRALEASGVVVTAQDLPTSTPVSVMKLLR